MNGFKADKETILDSLYSISSKVVSKNFESLCINLKDCNIDSTYSYTLE